MHPLGENLATTVEQDQTANPAVADPTDTTPVESILGGSIALSSSCSTPSVTQILIARVQKLKA